MIAISLWQPWATLIATRVSCTCSPGGGHWVTCPAGGIAPTMVKRYETRSRPCPPKYIGQHIAIHAAKRPPIEGDSVGRYVTTRRPDVAMPDGTRIPGRWIACDWDAPYEVVPIPLPLGAVVATAIVTASPPIVDGRGCDGSPHVCHRIGGGLLHHEQLTAAPAHLSTPTEHDIDDQLPYGDWTPGRHAWQLDDVHPVDPPVPAIGRQGWFTIPDLEGAHA